jgi:hypothetical protein
VQPDGVVVAPPGFDHDSCILQTAEDLAIEQLVAPLAVWTPHEYFDFRTGQIDNAVAERVIWPAPLFVLLDDIAARTGRF